MKQDITYREAVQRKAWQVECLGRDIDSMPPACAQHPHYLAVDPPPDGCVPCRDLYDWVNCQQCTNEALCMRHVS